MVPQNGICRSPIKLHVSNDWISAIFRLEYPEMVFYGPIEDLMQNPIWISGPDSNISRATFIHLPFIIYNLFSCLRTDLFWQILNFRTFQNLHILEYSHFLKLDD